MPLGSRGALVVVDFQPSGNLAVLGGDAVVPVLNDYLGGATAARQETIGLGATLVTLETLAGEPEPEPERSPRPWPESSQAGPR